DKIFVRGKDNYLYDNRGNCYLDFISSFGASPFGFNSREIWEVLYDIKERELPSLVQASITEASGKLAEKIIEVAPKGFRYVIFATTGSEAVSVAVKISQTSTKRRRILAAEGCFHGLSMGDFDTVAYGNISSLEKKLIENPDSYAGFIVEPIQGEGGIIIPPQGYLSQAMEICHKYGVLFIIDEVQTGLGRTGRLFACEKEGIIPDILIIGKVLGGGIYPISACLLKEETYTEEFIKNYSSTFAGNNIASMIGIKVLEMLTRDNNAIIRYIKENGERLLQELSNLKERFPNVIKDVRGEGYLLGIEIKMDRVNFPQCLLSVLSEQGNLVPLIVSYLLNTEKIRLAPTLSNNRVIRLEPSFITSWEECRRVSDALERVIETLNDGNTVKILTPILGMKRNEFPSVSTREREQWNIYNPSQHPQEGRFAFLVHPLDLVNYQEFDPTLSVLTREELQKLSEIGSKTIRPFVIGQTRVMSLSGESAYGEFITLPYTAKQMLELPQEKILNELEEALKLAYKNGARIAGLGAYTSVVSRGGLLLKGKVLPLTTGNSYTVASSIEAIKLAAQKLNVKLNQSTVAIIGATGSIGKALAVLMGEEAYKIILVGNPKHPKSSLRRLTNVELEIYRHLKGQIEKGWTPPQGSIGEHIFTSQEIEESRLIEITTNLDEAISKSQIIVTATNSPIEIINPTLVSPGAIICDISRPPNVSPKIKEVRQDILVIDGGIIEVPGRPSLGWNFGLERGLVYACMAETMMLALEHSYTDISLGTDLSVENILHFRRLAQKHGFKISQLRSFDRPISQEDWTLLLEARNRSLA
ncbi:MAG: aminotransferase class III-fold pyridoxal phosphate-dependent enzyme, partial [bacterium]